MTLPFEYTASGRNISTALVLLGSWLLLVLAFLMFQATPWLLGFLALFTLPALWDVISDRPSGLSMTSEGVRWFSGTKTAELAWSQVAYARFDTRLDFSVRVTFVLQSGRKIRVPFEATPPHTAFETELSELGIKVERHHFSLVG